MADSYVPTPNDGTTRKLASKTRTQGADTVHDQTAIGALAAQTTGSLTGSSQTVVATVEGYSSATVLFYGTYGAFLALFEVSNDGGSHYVSVLGRKVGGGATDFASVPSISANATVMYTIDLGPFDRLRVTAFTFASGTCSVVIVPSSTPNVSLQLAADTELAAPVALSDVQSRTSTVPTVGAAQLVDDGTQLVRARGNMEGTALASAARTGTANSSDIVNYNGRGVQVQLNVSSAGTGSIQPNVQGKNSLAGTYYKLAADPTAVTANGDYIYEFYPGASTAAAGGVTTRVAASLPRTWRVIVTHNNANSITYSVAYAVIV